MSFFPILQAVRLICRTHNQFILKFHAPGIQHEPRPIGVHRTPPHAFDDMQVSAAQASRTDTHNDLIGGGDVWFGHHLKFEINMHVLVVLVQSSSFHLDCSSPSIDPALRNAEQVDRTGSIMRRGFKGVDPVLACYPKLVAIDEEADHQLVHGRCCHLTHYG